MNKVRKVLLVAVNSVHTFNFYNLIRDSVDDIVLVTDRYNENYPDLQQHIVSFGMRDVFSAMKSIAGIREVIRNFSPDIIHVHLANSCAYYTIRANRKYKHPLIVTAWGSEVLVNPRKNAFVKHMLKRIVRQADAFTVDAEIVAEHLRKYAGVRPLNIVNTLFGIDIPQSTAGKEKIFYSNRLHESNYRIDKIIRAFHKFPDKQWKLRIGGSGSLTEDLKLLCKNLHIANRVEFPGWLSHEENYREYAKAMVYVSIPRSDATSVSVLEAMANGCLPVTSDLPAMREWIKQESNGFLVADADSDFLTEAMAREWEDIHTINKNIIKQKASPEVCLQKFLTLYDQLSGK